MGDPAAFSVAVSGLKGYVVIDRLVNGLAGGGLRFHPSVNLSEMRALARTMTQKWALLELPFGGCKLGIRGRSERADKATIIEEFAGEVRSFVQGRLFTGPDMGTSPSDLRPFFKVVGQDSYDVVAQRLISLGFRPSPKAAYRTIIRSLQGDITGRAVAWAAERAWSSLGGSFEGVKVSVQGFGSVGKAVAEGIAHLGASVVCVADAQGCLWDPGGLDLGRLAGPTPGLMSRRGLPQGTKALSGDQWIEADAEILIPAAISDAINWENVHRVRAEMVVEAANIPVAEDVELELHRKGILVLPDFLVNGGLAAAFGVLLTGVWEDAQEVEGEVVSRIVSSTSLVVDKSLSEGHSPREIAKELAMSRLGD